MTVSKAQQKAVAKYMKENYDEIMGRMQQYMEVFQISGVDRLVLEES